MKYKFKITLKFLNGEIFMEDVTETDNDEDYESARKLVSTFGSVDTFHFFNGNKITAIPKGILQNLICEYELIEWPSEKQM